MKLFKVLLFPFLSISFVVFGDEQLTTTLNVKQEMCELMPSQQQLSEGRLSDYWAQEMIGSDLLKEDLKKTPTPQKENFIAVYDSLLDQDLHGITVANLISGEGRHAVLPHICSADSLNKEKAFL